MTDRLSEERVEALVAVLARLASGDLAARGRPSPADDEIDAVIVGINMLAEELEASHAQLERRVAERTAEFERLNHDVMQLTDLGNLLQTCADPAEAYDVIDYAMTDMFEGLSGALFLYNSSRNLIELRASWGGSEQPETLVPSECWALRRGQRHLVRADAPTMSCRHVRERTGDSICIPMSAHGQTSGMVHLMDRRLVGADPQRWLTEARQRLAVAVSEQTGLSLANIELRETLRTQALRDPLTGLYNRRFAEEWMSREMSRTDRTGNLLGVIMADIDHFKPYNDAHGHAAGDLVLHAVAETMQGGLRHGDVSCRYGGEEFLLLLPDTTGDAAVARMESLRDAVAGARVSHRGMLLPGVTLSVGVALYPAHGLTATEVIRAADEALYTAKRAGRDRVALATR